VLMSLFCFDASGLKGMECTHSQQIPDMKVSYEMVCSMDREHCTSQMAANMKEPGRMV
jgi:hypothetical protein